LPYKQIFARLYPGNAADVRPLTDLVSITPDGRLNISFSASLEFVDLEVKQRGLSTVVLSGNAVCQSARTTDGRYSVEVATFVHQGVTEYWLIHTDNANGKFKRAKLASEYRPNGAAPRVVVSPGGTYFLVDDSGIVRLYTSAHLLEAGTFQVAHANTENQIMSLAVSADEQLVAGLSSWKDIVLYSVTERRVTFVRQIRDGIGWYAPDRGHILVVGSGEAVVTAAVNIPKGTAPTQLSVNAFKFIPIAAPVA
jgi:hypothetical protein